jgi:hypothetical protein
MRHFGEAGGATRDDDTDKLDFEGFLHPVVLLRYAEYMNQNRQTAEGLRGSDNWQMGDGIPRRVYMSSLWRHFHDMWLHHRGHGDRARESLEDAICGIMFNAQGYLFQVLVKHEGEQPSTPPESHHWSFRYIMDKYGPGRHHGG